MIIAAIRGDPQPCAGGWRKNHGFVFHVYSLSLRAALRNWNNRRYTADAQASFHSTFGRDGSYLCMSAQLSRPRKIVREVSAGQIV